MAAKVGNANSLRHGHASGGVTTPEYKAWASMIQRCTNPKSKSFKNYGGRGIAVCQKWLHSFDAFITDVGPRPSPRHSLGRKKNDGNYTPDNVRWESPEEQQSNTRNNRVIAAFGETHIISEWARIKQIPLDTLWRRIVIHGWDVERALTTPVPPKKDALSALVRNAGYENISDFLRRHSISPATLYKLVGEKLPGVETVKKLAKLLKTSPARLNRLQAEVHRAPA